MSAATPVGAAPTACLLLPLAIHCHSHRVKLHEHFVRGRNSRFFFQFQCKQQSPHRLIFENDTIRNRTKQNRKNKNDNNSSNGSNGSK